MLKHLLPRLTRLDLTLFEIKGKAACDGFDPYKFDPYKEDEGSLLPEPPPSWNLQTD
jgi:hypothetical protein